MDKLQRRLRETEEDFAGEQLADHLTKHEQLARDRALMMLGSFKTATKIAHAINSEVMRALELFQQDGVYRVFGYDRFVDFLDDHENSPMSKAQYYERKALLDKEGDQMFNLMSDLGISIRKRKLLGRGNVEIDGDNAIIRDAEGEETIVPITDHVRLMEVVTAVVDAKISLQHKFERQKETIESQEVTIRNAHDDLDRARSSKIADLAGNPHMIARVELGLAFRKMSDAADALSAIEKDQFRDAVLEDIAAWRMDLAGRYETGNRRSAPITVQGDDFGDAFDQFLVSVDLESVNNDGDLAAQL